MTEKYIGPRFNTVFLSKEIPYHPAVPHLMKWGRRFAELGLAPQRGNAYAGNLSFRAPSGFIITAAGADLGKLVDDDMVLVVEVTQDSHSVTVHGKKEPSSESFLHHAIYAARPQVQAVFHGHDELILQHAREIHLPVTVREQPYGSLELAKEVLQVLGVHNYTVIRNHGFIASGKDLEQAGQEALEKHRLAQQYAESTTG
jgi:L-fuculose-phosphate aldolase